VIVMMSKQSDVGSSDCSRTTPALHRPFEDSDTPSQQRQIHQRSALLRQQFPAFIDVAAAADPTRIPDPRLHAGCLQDPRGPMSSTLRQLSDDRVFVPVQQRCATSTAADELEADDDDDDTVDSATFNVSSNTNHANGLLNYQLTHVHTSRHAS